MGNVISPALAYPTLFQQAAGSDPEIEYEGPHMRGLIWGLYQNQGVLAAGQLKVRQRATPGWWITIEPGAAVVNVNVAGKVPERFYQRVPAAFNVDLSTINTSPSGTVNHKVFLVIYDAEISGSGYGAKIYVSEDPGGGAQNPVGTVGYLELATIKISGGQANILDSHITNTAAVVDPGPAAPARAVASFGSNDLVFPSDGYIAIASRVPTLLTGGMTMPTAKHVKVPRAGYYRMTASARVYGGAAGKVFTARIARNANDDTSAGSTMALGYRPAQPAINNSVHISGIVAQLNADDTVALFIVGVDGATLFAGPVETWLCVEQAG